MGAIEGRSVGGGVRPRRWVWLLVAVACAVASVVPAGVAGAEGDGTSQPVFTHHELTPGFIEEPDDDTFMWLGRTGSGVSADGRTAVVAAPRDIASRASGRFELTYDVVAQAYASDGDGGWVAKGDRIRFVLDRHADGVRVSVSADGGRVALGLGSGRGVRQVRVFTFAEEDDGWRQDGEPLVPTDDIGRFPERLSLSADGNTLLVGKYASPCPLDPSQDSSAVVHVRQDGRWRPEVCFLGLHHAMSSDATTIAMVVGSAHRSRYLRVLERTADGAWAPRGEDILLHRDPGDGTQNTVGDVQLTADGGRVVVSFAELQNGAVVDAWTVRVYDFDGTGWVERVQRLTNDDSGDSDRFGQRLGMSADGSMLAVHGRETGLQLYALEDRTWVPEGPALTLHHDRYRPFGLSGDGRTVTTIPPDPEDRPGSFHVHRLLSPPVLEVEDVETSHGTPVTVGVSAVDPDGGPVSVEFDHGDGFVDDATFAASEVGSFPVVVRATDDDGQVAQVTVTVTVVALVGRSLLQRAADSVDAARASSPLVVKDLERAAGHLADADVGSAWDGDRLVSDAGKDVFKDLVKAADRLLKAREKAPLTAGAAAAVDAALADLVALAQQLVGERSAALDALELTDDDDVEERDEAHEKAAKAVAKAERELGDGDLDKAIHHLGKAWEELDEALEALTGD